jgi:hypothetical protein
MDIEPPPGPSRKLPKSLTQTLFHLGKRSARRIQQDAPTYTVAIRPDGMHIYVWGPYQAGQMPPLLAACQAPTQLHRSLLAGEFSYEAQPAATGYRIHPSAVLVLSNLSEGIRLTFPDPRGRSGAEHQFPGQTPAIKIQILPWMLQRLGYDLFKVHAEVQARLRHWLQGITIWKIARFDVAVDVGGLPLQEVWHMVQAGHLHAKLVRKPNKNFSDNNTDGTGSGPTGITIGDSWKFALVIYDKLINLKKIDRDYDKYKYLEANHALPMENLTRFEFRFGSLLADGRWGNILDLYGLINAMPVIFQATFENVRLFNEPYNKANPSRNTISPLWTKIQSEVMTWAEKQPINTSNLPPDISLYYGGHSPSVLGVVQKSSGSPALDPKKLGKFQQSMAANLHKFAAAHGLNYADPDVKQVLWWEAIHGTWNLPPAMVKMKVTSLRNLKRVRKPAAPSSCDIPAEAIEAIRTLLEGK